MVDIMESGGWVYYLGRGHENLDPDRCGKWMWHFPWHDMELAAEVCDAAVRQGVVSEAKHNAWVCPSYLTGVCCLYLNGDDDEGHRMTIEFLMEQGLIPCDEEGAYEDIPFKYDWQTMAGQYEDSFVPEITLSQFVDLRTGKWID